MNILDIILLILFVWSAYVGLREGIIVQLGGIAGLFIGAFLAFRFGAAVGRWIGMDTDLAAPVGFLIVLAVVLILVALISRLLSAIFNVAGLGVFNKLGGAVLSVLKAVLVFSLLLYCFDYFNKDETWVKKEKLEGSIFYQPLIGVATQAFPYIDFIKERLFELPAPKVEPADGNEDFADDKNEQT